jgi:hypothetical protein
MAHWHGLVKLRLHTDVTLDMVNSATTLLGQALRDFKANTCSTFTTRELRREVNARNRRQAKKSATQKLADNVTQTSRLKEFNLNTYKFHALGDVANAIREFGTTESYSTEPVSLIPISLANIFHVHYVQGELEHRTPKSRYKRTSKKNYLKQLTQIERRQARIRQIRRQLNAGKTTSACDGEVEYASSPKARYYIGKSQNEPVVLPIFLQENRGDPAIKVSNTHGQLSLF